MEFKYVFIALIIVGGILWANNINNYLIEETDIEDPSPVYSTTRDYKFTDSQLEKDVLKYMDYIEPYYYYNYSNRLSALTIEKLKEQGGVCRHYAYWYIDLAKQDGYYAYKERTDWRDGTAHAKAKITSVEGNYYIECYIDQTTYWCNKLWRRTNEE